MVKPLTFQLGDQELAMAMQKIDRSKLYGSKELEVVDDQDHPCELATLADDGRTLIGRGGTGLGWIDAVGAWCDKSELKPINVDGDEIQPVASSFNAPIKLFETASVDEYLEHDIRLAYALHPASDAGGASGPLDELRMELQRGTIFSFPYSYRGGLEADSGFLLLSESDEIMLAIGHRTEFSFVSIQSQAPVDDEANDKETEEDALDFDMI